MSSFFIDELNHMLINHDAGALTEKSEGMTLYSSMIFGAGVEHTDNATDVFNDAILTYCEDEAPIEFNATHKFENGKHVVVVGELVRDERKFNAVIVVETGDDNIISYRDFTSPKSS
ncbi:MAG: hypothetical protein AAGG69_00135 [Pseudomonadota bacterium]